MIAKTQENVSGISAQRDSSETFSASQYPHGTFSSFHPIRSIEAGAPAPEPVVETDPTDAADEPVRENTIETFEDEPIP
ncbi:MAG TPA: hypothetical protein PLD84_11530 [Chitinophagales bacterium]|nr:hypothetical protein [Chitinophagales bacterium]